MPVTTYHLDASDAGPTDASADWADDADTFNGSTADRALNSGNGTGWLSGDGTTAPTTGDYISRVQWRVNAENNIGDQLNHEIREDSPAGAVLDARSTSVAAQEWNSWGDLLAPSGGWTWQKVNDLSYRVQTNAASDVGGAYAVEVRVFAGELVHFYDTEDASAGFLSTTYSNTPNSGSAPAQILGADLKANTKYLIVARALIGGNNAGATFGCRIQTDDDSTIEAKSESIVEVEQASSTSLMSYFFPHSFTTSASPADVEFQLFGYGSQESYIRLSSLFLLDLDAITDAVSLGTFYFDASDAGPTDTGGDWDNDANAFDGSDSTEATSNASGNLSGEGTTAPTSGATIGDVQFRAYMNAEIGAVTCDIDEDSVGGTQLGTVSQASLAGWTNWQTLTAPGGGWTWQKVNDLACEFSTTSSNKDIRKVEVRVLGTDGLGYFEDIQAASGDEYSTSTLTTNLAQINAADIGTVEHVYFGCARADIGSTGRWFQHTYTLANFTGFVHQAEGEDTTEQRLSGFSFIATGNGSQDVRIFGVEEAANGNMLDGGAYLIGLPTSLFADAEQFSNSNQIAIDGTETTIGTLAYTPTVNGNHLVIGSSTGGTFFNDQLGGIWMEEGTVETRIGDAAPTHNQIWDDAKDREQQISWQRYAVLSSVTFNLRSQGAAADFDQTNRRIVVINLSPPVVAADVYPPFPRRQSARVRM